MSAQVEEVKADDVPVVPENDQGSSHEKIIEELSLISQRFAGQFSDNALLLSLLHASKYPSQNVVGVLIGTASKDQVNVR